MLKASRNLFTSDFEIEKTPRDSRRDCDCRPATLARDLNILAALGYRTIKIQPVDMFPFTSHVESVAQIVHT